MVGGVIQAYLTLLGAALAGLVVLVVIFIASAARALGRGWSPSTVLATASGGLIILLSLGAMGLAAALLRPVLVAAVAGLGLGAIGYVAWGFRRLLSRGRLAA